jgi:tetratricopeptide (TPR) repeat protein
MTIVPPSGEGPKNVDRVADGDRIHPASNQESVLLESDVPVSQSLIWRLQREFYAQRGLKSWTEDMVPQFITNNPFFAEIYARIVFAFICDCLEFREGESPSVSVQKPLRIFELGAGPGKFAFLFLRQLEPLLRAKNISLNTVRYCMTDCSEILIESWSANPYLSEFVERRILQFQQFGTEGETGSRFLSGDGLQQPEASRGPLVVIANYVFDSLPHDAFLVKDAKIFELLQSTTAPWQEGGKPACEALSRLQFSYENLEIAAGRYAEQSWNNILEDYRQRLSGATVLFPSQALKTLKTVGEFTDGPMLVMVADKGYVSEDALLLSPGTPGFEFHSTNCFSQMVNIDAIAKYFQALGGEALLPDKQSSSLNICAFLQDRLSREFPLTKAKYQETRSAIGPDDLFALLGWLNPHMEEISVTQILSIIRLSRWDAAAFVRLFPVLARQVRTVSAERNDLRDAVRRTWMNHFPLNPQENILAFQCGVILLELRLFEEAFAMFIRSQALLSRSAANSYNLGLCSQGLGRSEEALAFMTEACLLDPAFGPALLARKKLETGTKTRAGQL